MPRRVYNRVYSEEIWEQVNPQSKELLEDFVLDLRARKMSPNTIHVYHNDLRGFLCHLYTAYQNRFVLELNKKELRRYALSLSDERKLSNARRNGLMASLKSMLDYAEEDDDWEYEINAARMVKSLSKDPVKPIIFVPDSAVMKLYDDLMQLERYQHAALLMLAYDSAARRAELAQAEKFSFLDPACNNTNVVVGKGGKKFSLIYFDLTRQAAVRWLEQRGEDDISDLFIADVNGNRHEADPMDVYRMFASMRPLLEDLPGDDELDFTAHSMRHSALANYRDGSHYVCRQLGSAGFALDQLKLIAHHDNAETTLSYLPDTSEQELESMFGIAIR